MLGPNDRALLLDALRPPGSYRLEAAVGTTFSLDLQALLLPPLSFALLDWAAGEDGEPNPLALLEALRRNAERMTVFCQAGEIALPRTYRPLLVHLEPCVVEVTPPDPARIFHPKVWALKFVSDGGPPAYRLLCATRNLTFDRAWDTVLVLDGAPAEGDRRAVRRRNRPLQRFLAGLPDLAVRPVEEATRQRTAALADELGDAAFALPEGFDDLAFHVLGLGQGGTPFGDDIDRLFVVAPFLTKGALTRLAGTGGRHVLVSRQEALDAVGGLALAGFEQVFILAEHAWAELAGDEAGIRRDDVAAAATDEAVAEAADAELTGLHAKLYLAEQRSHVRVLTGSANATDAAFAGNVEVLVELASRRSRHGIDVLLEAGAGEPGFRDLLEPTRAATEESPAETPAEAVARLLDEARRVVGACRFVASANAHDEGFELALRGEAPRPLRLESVTGVRCWPVSLGAGHAVTASLDEGGLAARFGRVSTDALTAFFAVELTAEHAGAEDSVRFVCNADLEGAPDDRRERVLVDLLRSRADVLRYLLFLLSGDDIDAQQLADALTGDRLSSNRREAGGWEAPLLESMVRALVAEPERLDHLARVITDIRRTGRADELLPHDIGLVWEPIWQARQELGP